MWQPQFLICRKVRHFSGPALRRRGSLRRKNLLLYFCVYQKIHCCVYAFNQSVMPPVNHSTISPVDEIKVYQDEGEGEEEQKSSAENLKEVKCSLVTEEEEKASAQISHPSFIPSKRVPTDERQPDDRSSLPPPGRRYDYLSPPPFGYVYTHPNAAYSMVNRVPLVPSNHAPLSFMHMYNSDFQPPPAHIGIPPVHVDPKTGVRTPLLSLPPPSRFHPTVFSPEFSHQFSWPHHSMYSFPPSFRSPPYPSTYHPSAHLPSKFSPPPPTLAPSRSDILPNLSHPPSLVRPKTEDRGVYPEFIRESHPVNHNPVNSLPQRNQNTCSQQESSLSERARSEKKKSHIKKPLNAFMLFMKEQRPQVVAECTLKESAAINQLLEKKWHSLSREEQSKYYELAKKERQVHMLMYPGWTARDNYAINAKKKKRKRDKSQEGDANNPKKCRARFGLDRQSSWCKPCRRKKKCIRYLSGSDNNGESEDNIGSVDSLGSLEVPTPDSRFGGENTLSDNDSGNGDIDDELEVSSEFSLSSPPVPRPPRDSVQLSDPIGSPSLQMLNVQQISRPAACLEGPDTPPSTDSSSATAPLHAVT